jgi:hypothetical protein
MPTQQAIQQAIQTTELAAFGIAMPRLAPDWAPSGTSPTFTVDDTTMTMTVSGAHWAAPLACSLYLVDAANGFPFQVSLFGTDGKPESTGGVLLTVFEQAWRRLGRLYTDVLEVTATNRPEHARGLPVRPVPRHFFFPGATTTVKQGMADPWVDLGFSGPMRIYDTDGLPIDPIGAMAAFAAILKTFGALQAIPIGGSLPATAPLQGRVNTLATPVGTRVRLMTPSGAPYAGAHLQTGLTAISAAAGLYSLTGAALTLDAVSASFPQADRDRLVLGPATSGRLTDSFTPPAVPGGVALPRDFFTLRVVDLKPYLLGTPAAADPASQVQKQADIRVHEPVTLLGDGNDVLAAISQALPAAATPSLAVAQAIDGGFSLPTAVGAAAHWPGIAGVTPVAAATLSVGLAAALTLTAGYISTNASDFAKADVVLTLTPLPASAWVRIYPRKFISDAREGRGDGQGRPVPASGTLQVRLTDPLGLRKPLDTVPGDVIVPAQSTLRFDMIVVLGNGKARIYGNLSAPIAPGPTTDPAFTAGTNTAGTAQFRGITTAGILGLGAPVTPPVPPTALAWLQLLTGEGNPRNAPRLPTMARRELLVAGKTGTSWSGVIAAGRLTREAICGDTRLGAPGSLGGRETIVTGAASQGGRLAYDIARHAFRRGKNLVERVVALADAAWDVPAEPAPVPVGSVPAADQGTFAAAVVQTVAPFCETPELHAIFDSNPGFSVDQAIESMINNVLPAGLPMRTEVVNALRGLEQNPPAGTTPADPNGKPQRMAAEFERELTSSLYGRRDMQWALTQAISDARHFIYIETPGFCSTADRAAAPPAWTLDLIARLAAKLTANPALRLIIGIPKYPDYAPGFEGMATAESVDRRQILVGDPAAIPKISPLPIDQTVAFHPIGFPGRPSRIETQLVIVDDCWLSIGGSTFRRRGLTFDGSSDLVLTDTQLEDGRSPAIRDFRAHLLASRLGIAPDPATANYMQLVDPVAAFRLIRQTLQADGLGKIDVLWNGVDPGVIPATALPADQFNPEGRSFDVLTGTLIAALAASANGV